MKSRKHALAGAAFCAAAAIGAAAQAAPHYSLTLLLGPPGSTESAGNGINNAGVVAGWTEGADGYSHTTTWANGSAQVLDTSGAGFAISNNGLVAGYGANGAAIYGPGSSTTFVPQGGSYATGLTFGEFYAVNQSGTAVGSAEAFYIPQTFDYHAIRSNPDGTYSYLGTLGRNSEANAINNAGLIVGDSQYAGGGGATHAFIYDQTGMHDIGTLAGAASAAWGVNDSGVVVGGTTFSDNPDAMHAFAWVDGVWTDLGALGQGTEAQAFAINDAGEIVGTSALGVFTGDYSELRATLWENGQIWDLNDLIAPHPDFTLIGAAGLNDRGQIVGWGYDNGGAQWGFLLTPVPEPTTWAMMVIGLGALGALLRTRGRKLGAAPVQAA